MEFITGGVSSLNSGKVTGNLETEYKVKDIGLTFTKKWSTDNTLNSTLDVTTKLFSRLKVTLDTNFTPATGSKSGKLKTEYKHEAATMDCLPLTPLLWWNIRVKNSQ